MSRKTAVFGGVLAAASLLLGVFASEITAGPRVYVNGERVNADVILKDDRTYLPLRAVAEAMGAEVRYEEDTDCVFVNFTEEDARAKVIEEASKSVVAIIGNYYQDTNAAGRYNKPRVHGSGVIVKSNGAIVTNALLVCQ